MLKFLTQRAKWIIVGFGIFIFALSQTNWLTSSELWQKGEGASVDKRYIWRGEQAPDSNIRLIGLETSSFQLDALSTNEIAMSPTLQLMQQPWPWDRRVYAAVLEKLMSGGAKVVVFDFVFASQMNGDDEFALALQKYKDHVVIGEMFAPEENAINQEVNGAPVKLTAPNNLLLQNGVEASVGLVNQWSDSDQVIRKVRYHTSLEREKLEHDPYLVPNVVQILQQAIRENKVQKLTHISALTVEKFTGNDAAPVDDGLRYIDFQGSAGTYEPLQIENMFVDEMWTNPPFSSGTAFSNKIVIVGPMAEIFHDVHPTPFGDMAGPELQAQIIAALLHHSWLTGTSALIAAAIAFAMLLLALGICLLIRNALLKVGLLVATTILFFVLCQTAFSYHKLVLPMMQPLFCLAVPGAFGIAFQYAVEQFERLRTRGLLERYVSKNVAKTILDDQRSFIESLSGRKQAVTVLFSDIRGFTSMTESSDAHQLVAQLNEYFLEMVGVVLKEDGTLQKFIGDAIMAAWGDTHSEGLAEDARRAVATALQMRGALAKLNDRWKSQSDREKLKIGIGINHGEIIVGNIGHPQRMEFTVLGDGVNLAARLESATKQFHTDVLIGEEVEKLTRDNFIYRNVGAIAFKGKTKPVETFVLLGDRSQSPPDWLATYHGAIKVYRSQNFDLAEKMFREVQMQIGAEDFLCEMYLERCEACRQQPLPASWDGSFALTEK